MRQLKKDLNEYGLPIKWAVGDVVKVGSGCRNDFSIAEKSFAARLISRLGGTLLVMTFVDTKFLVVVVVITPHPPRDGGTAQTPIQVHAINLIKIRLKERWQPISNQS